MKKITHICSLLTCFLITVSSLNAQIVISAPNLGFSQACASESFNIFFTTFTFSPEAALNNSNQFIVELSNALGDFSDATIVYVSEEGEILTSPATVGFSLPDTTAGESYKIRLRSTAPETMSSNSVSFAAYFKIHDEPFSINNLIENVVFCSGSSYLLSIDDPGNENNNSPLQYESLSFNWYRETSATTSIFLETSEALSVTEPGTYFVETNYGTCTSNSFSNRVTLSEAASGVISASVNSSLGNPYCVTEGPTTLSTISGNSYQWYKDSNEISGATNQEYTTNESGFYEVNVSLGDCSVLADINLENKDFISSINVSDTIQLENDEAIQVIVSTTADNPEYVWYLNGIEITDEISNSYDIYEPGNYVVIVTQTLGCNASDEFSFVVVEQFPDVTKIPNLISPNGDGINDTWVLPQQYATGSNTEVLILDSNGTYVLKTTEYQNDWPQNQINNNNTNPVYYYVIISQDDDIRKGSITVIK
jgi:gliding motility-associated-like protein